jgi:peptidyl-prolyl cis-trans isomerase C
LAQDASDGPSGVEGGALPRFGRQQMVRPFSDAAFGLKPGEISEIVETNFGFHIIKRTE